MTTAANFVLDAAAHGSRLIRTADTGKVVGHWVRPAGVRTSTGVLVLTPRGTSQRVGNSASPKRTLALVADWFDRHPDPVPGPVFRSLALARAAAGAR